MAIVVKLEVFEGPLDLLLHLIEKNKVDIFDIPIVEITDQYLEYVRNMQTEDMNVISEFLLIAATLLDIKCRMLLPKTETEDDEEDEEDPRKELVEKLLEYKMYKYMSYELKDRQMDAGKALFKAPTIPEQILEYKEPVDYTKLVGDMTLQKLNDIFQTIMKRSEDRVDPIRSKFGNVTKDEIPLDDKQKYIFTYLMAHKRCSFTELLEKQQSKMEIIVTFLVVLELMKVGQISISQDELFDDIIIERTGDEIGLEDGFAIV